MKRSSVDDAQRSRNAPHEIASNEIADARRTAVCCAAMCIVLIASAGCAAFDNKATAPAGGLSVQSGKSRYHQNKGVQLYHEGDLFAAARALEYAVTLNPLNAAAHNNLGLVRYDQHKLFLAATNFQDAAELRPNDPKPLNNLGMTLEAGGRGDEAMEYYSLAHRLDPINPLYLGNYVRTRIRLGENDPSVIAQLKELRFIEERPQWLAWIDRQLALELNPYLDRGPEVQL